MNHCSFYCKKKKSIFTLVSFLAAFNHLSMQLLSLSSCHSLSHSASYYSRIIQGAQIPIFYFCGAGILGEKKISENPTKMWCCLNNIPPRLIGLKQPICNIISSRSLSSG